MTQPLFEYHRGLHLRDTPLWLDADQPRELCFVSHAQVRDAYRHQKILCSQNTAELLQTMAAAHGRGRHAHEPQALVTPFSRTFALGRLSLELFPSGNILGAASLLIMNERQRLVYAGVINPGRNALVERLEARTCDVLVLPDPPPRGFALPDPSEIGAKLLRFVAAALDDGYTPVLLCPPIGEAQQAARLLLAAGFGARAHRQIFAACSVYRARSPEGKSLEGIQRHVGAIDPSAKQALLWPLALHGSSALAKVPRARRAVVSPRAHEPEVRAALRCEAGFALSARGDYRALLEYVRACSPKRVVVTGSDRDAELAEDLGALGIEVSQIGPRRQLDLF